MDPSLLNQWRWCELLHWISTSEALVLPSTPMVLSVGRRCVGQGYSLVWEANAAPYMKSPEGKIVHLAVDGYTPYLVDDQTEQLVLPAVGMGWQMMTPPRMVPSGI